MNPIRFNDLDAQQKRIRKGIDQRFSEVLSHGRYILGPEIDELEKELERFSGARHVITCANGTDALLLVLMAMGIGKNHAVFTSPFTFIATAEVIALVGATPVFVDIDPDTYILNSDKLELAIQAVLSNDSSIYPLPVQAIGERLIPGCIIPVDLFGLPADYDIIETIAKKYGLFVLADAAQSFGSLYKGKPACTRCQAAATSFFPAKPLGCYGDGGAVITSDDTLAETIRSIRVHGMGPHKYDNLRIGMNSRLDTLQAAVLLEKLPVFEQETAEKNRIAAIYSDSLKHHVTVPIVPDAMKSVWAQYSVRSSDREMILESLKHSQVPTAIYYPKPLHLQTAFSYLCYRAGDFPLSETASRTIFSLPMHPYLTDEQIDYILQTITKLEIIAPH
ncbi:MAG: DegT/DnrJ/EryC1/StrS family aminotransferase [Pseudomonadota bacterium]